MISGVTGMKRKAAKKPSKNCPKNISHSKGARPRI